MSYGIMYDVGGAGVGDGGSVGGVYGDSISGVDGVGIAGGSVVMLIVLLVVVKA